MRNELTTSTQFHDASSERVKASVDNALEGSLFRGTNGGDIACRASER